MKKFINVIAALSLLVTSSAVPTAFAADLSATSASIGFEDGNIYSASVGGGVRTLTTDAADGSKYAIDVTLDSDAGTVGVKLGVKAGQTYNVSAKVKPLANGEAGSGIKVWLEQASGYASTQLTASGGAVSLPLNEWSTVSGTINATTTDTKEFMLRYGQGNNNKGSHFIIDDIVIEPVIPENESGYVVDMNFDDKTLENKGTGGGTAVFDGKTDSMSYFSYNGGNAVSVNDGVWGGYKFLEIQKVLLKPNTTYKITYDMNQKKSFAVGKAVRLNINRSGYHKRFDGVTDSKKQLSNVFSDVYTIEETGWQSVTQYITTSDNNSFDEQGYGNLYFQFYMDNTCQKTVGGDTLRFEFDNLKVEEVNVPNGAFFEKGQMPKNSSKATVTYNSEINGLDVAVETADGNSDVQFGLGIDDAKDYILSYDIRGTEGLQIRPLVIGEGSLSWKFVGNAATLTDDWQTYTTVVNYSTEPYYYPQLILRPVANTGSYRIKNIKIIKKPATGVYNISCGELKDGENAAISFSDYASESAGYVYSIYSKNADGSKIVWASGTTTDKTINYKVNAAAGKEIFVSIASISDGNVQSAPAEKSIGSIEVIKEFSIKLEINKDDEGFLTGGSAAVVNDNSKKTLVLYIAQYDGNKLVKVDKSTSEILPNEEKTFTVETTEADSLTHVRLFAWDENYRPYVPAEKDGE